MNIVKNTISVQNVTFSSGATVNDIDAAINRVVNGMFSDESNTSSAESSDSSDMEEKQNEDVKHIDQPTSNENAESSHGEEIDVENIAESESTTCENPAIPVANVLLTSVSIRAISAAS